ncbi:biotin--[acetyl-CoA-carboxylase] ligase [Microbacterium sp. ARD31]|jgi:BirA family biotin operon repressor/biotin-[acetyl-CoA-carboxylase] ligase|uniref:biotin--[acetyl-CoA-carboxylase] ligase n=1 Tax=Microbacterium sp. ARD31 TaxID=2962576 RepID=UPI00288282B6|nr:biotin--[acetyl-CoA-carboxylase] ligase [Microbacterium sp. ARD31]MDT0187650.1 biotin--[acetyl-CoA-carboxylase] ligase [Microbacterium sp. ARD31]
MSIPSEGFPLAAAVSPRVQVVTETGSTNADLVDHLIDDPSAWPHLSVLLTDDQRAGRGRLDREWIAPPGMALAISTVLRVDALPVSARGWIPLMAGAAMTRAVSAQLVGTVHSARLKWPNDVLLDGRKLCGILAQVVPADAGAVVVGAGVNTDMPAEALPVPSATSLRTAGVEADADRLLADYLTSLDEQLQSLIASGGDAAAAGVRAEVETLCDTIGTSVVVSLPDGTTLSGTGARIDGEGRLVVHGDSGGETVVGAGDVVHVR